MKFRHEYKIPINLSDVFSLRHRLAAVMSFDSNSPNGAYRVRSLYFDTPDDRALLEKINGISIREKFRLRYYNENTNFIRLEKKSKFNGLCNKDSFVISENEAHQLSRGIISRIDSSTPRLLAELYSKMQISFLRPKSVVDYLREAYVFPAGNVRVTIDSDIRTSFSADGFLDPQLSGIPTHQDSIILEIKWDEFLPSVIRDAVALSSRYTSSFSKYAISRIYG